MLELEEHVLLDNSKVSGWGDQPIEALEGCQWGFAPVLVSFEFLAFDLELEEDEDELQIIFFALLGLQACVDSKKFLKDLI